MSIQLLVNFLQEKLTDKQYHNKSQVVYVHHVMALS